MKRFVLRFVPLLILCSLLVSLPKINIAKAGGTTTVMIEADGSVSGLYASRVNRDGAIYTLTGSIDGSVVVLRDNIVINGAGFSIQGPYKGIDLSNRNNVTIKNAQIKTELDNYGYAFCIILSSSSNNTISENKITAPYNPQSEVRYVRCIFLEFSSNNIISGNNITSINNEYGLSLQGSPKNIISNNKFISCGFSVANSYQNNVVNNTVNGKPLVYLEGVSDYVIEDAAQVTLVNCNNMKVKNLVLPLPLARAPFTPSSIGIQLLKTKNTEITNNVADIYLENSSRNVVSGNKGVIKLVESANNRISGNNWWINLFNSSNNVISGNEGGILACHCADVSIVENSLGGIELQNSEGFLISGNNITGNGKGEGILLDFSSYNTICDNIIADHNYGFYLRASSGNTVYGNNIIDNYDQVCSWYSSNVWDDGSKGNYWSDYRGEDANGDGIGDTPYIIAIQGSIPAANDQDNYPLMEPFVIPPPTESFPNIWIIAAAVLMAVVGVALLVYFRKRNH